MDPDTRPERLAHLLAAAGPAHHRAYIETNGADAEWPLWYAAHLQEGVNDLLGTERTRSEPVYLLVAADQAFRAEAPDRDWPSYYADYLLEHGVLRGAEG